MNKEDNEIYSNSIVKTEHYKFVLQRVEQFKPLHQIQYIVGDEKKPCLEAYVLLPDNGRLHDLGVTSTANLSKIEALMECSRNDITNNYMEKYSFGTELLEFIINLISKTYKHVKHISLYDNSHIPCNRKKQDELDLLTYSIAKYGKTWYETKLNVRLESKVKQDKYDKQIKYYISKELKSLITFDNLVKKIYNNNFAINYISTNLDYYKIVYEESVTLPDFFKKLSELVPRSDVCKFFKDWLEWFIKDYISVESHWIYDIPRKNIGGYKRTTRKIRK
jgi:hypothetical protein